ncbi:1-(5-phosphoribosyl)-5-[(5-phosphoribosylamino)methylideneamino]imidazole-4-carboxamide isomerase [Azospirillum sp. CT11-132]|jgi:phosphoribosylformimino-5-aminoimidazole carboxamide ribotide isomerase|uniref:1-(5-phosphoribosyl)-5-[(5-phosphoribosylamino)methylideneamino] imidazole-4-carboxamide isomerase n=1 Tax=Azospirillum endophyticum TaxID=2800326 RepID=A0ABS1F5S8_9PROT|nr:MULTISPECIES: 1-(5-phosphoribosyl)-5-[(5-phosphoribosylamino)methylideneamino]imidazole-4-carboxamide isomerase [Azospirillum]MBK1838800.1 1-(5-phosphoribosyl)-5-[(5-phosphoribosylamino)methylideneamino]imidazole-4-carboxamide isomerase [Azospirillum endophyticum]MCM8734959.1 1-(5-phosphoribosyl)-5-[(5-phosphoribosylamino)methylideneamino]imidazole-4-carboxamide isomerase [Azospirillum sp. A1-3]PWC63584.1 1-(5-phosphoribosyl)-5-[(5-phosphoribosylamino)methylideneamino] imidazole-4-carboxamide
MIIYPAIDLKDGACVRLLRGEMSQATVFNTDPGEQARLFQSQGFEWLHLVDLNGAFEGKPVNGAAVESILKSVTIPVQLGGGIRDLNTIGMWLEKGISRVILGTVALRDPELVKAACREFPGKVAVGIDAREGYVAVAGWAETSDIKALDLALKFEDCGVAAIIYTDINRDGAMGGVNVESTSDLAFHLTTPVIASGGVSSIEDLKALKLEEDTGIEGVICGRALYDGRIDPKEALALLSAPAVEDAD